MESVFIHCQHCVVDIVRNLWAQPYAEFRWKPDRKSCHIIIVNYWRGNVSRCFCVPVYSFREGKNKKSSRQAQLHCWQLCACDTSLKKSTIPKALIPSVQVLVHSFVIFTLFLWPCRRIKVYLCNFVTVFNWIVVEMLVFLWIRETLLCSLPAIKHHLRYELGKVNINATSSWCTTETMGEFLRNITQTQSTKQKMCSSCLEHPLACNMLLKPKEIEQQNSSWTKWKQFQFLWEKTWLHDKPTATSVIFMQQRNVFGNLTICRGVCRIMTQTCDGKVQEKVLPQKLPRFLPRPWIFFNKTARFQSSSGIEKAKRTKHGKGNELNWMQSALWLIQKQTLMFHIFTSTSCWISISTLIFLPILSFHLVHFQFARWIFCFPWWIFLYRKSYLSAHVITWDHKTLGRFFFFFFFFFCEGKWRFQQFVLCLLLRNQFSFPSVIVNKMRLVKSKVSASAAVWVFYLLCTGSLCEGECFCVSPTHG